MSYPRVIPRDLFNDGDLLKCLGKLDVLLTDRRDHEAEVHHVVRDRFEIEQDPSDGSISCSSIVFLVGTKVVPLFRPLNARSPWPLWARFPEEDIRVFTEEGDLSPELLVFVGVRS